MALKTIGTATTSSLKGFQIPDLVGATSVISAADIAAVANNIFDDVVGIDGGPNNPVGAQNLAQRIWPGALQFTGAGQCTVFVPNRGRLNAYAGDWIAFDPNTGAVFIIPANTMPTTLTATGTTTNNQPTITFASSVLLLGWTVGMSISGTNVPANSFIQQISADGKTVTLGNASSNLATGGGSNTMTVSNWTHN